MMGCYMYIHIYTGYNGKIRSCEVSMDLVMDLVDPGLYASNMRA